MNSIAIYISIYILPVTIPKKFVKSLNSLIFRFLWNSNWERIKRKTLIGPKMKGGIEMVDVESTNISKKLKWLYHLIDESKERVIGKLLNFIIYVI